MGYLPRGYYDARLRRGPCRARPAGHRPRRSATSYYVGLGFWYGFRHRAAARSASSALTRHVEPLYVPLC